MCGSAGCTARKLPDQIVIDLLKKRQENKQYIPLRFPTDYKRAATFDWMDRVRRRMLAVTPETSLSAAERYLRDASYLLFVWRSLQGITKSESKDLIEPFERILQQRADGRLIKDLRSMLDELRGATDRGNIDGLVMRVKALFFMIRAASLLGLE